MKDKIFYKNYIEAFLKQNAKLNLISKNDENFLWEKHIYDSLSIGQFFSKYKIGKTLLDIGAGGGFPSVPVALTYPEIEVYALDSIRKKINAIEELKSELNINNLHIICDRAENIMQYHCHNYLSNIETSECEKKFDIITSRAVAPLKVITGYAMPLLEKNGYFVAYKSKKALEEIAEAKTVLKKYNAEIIDIIEYDLPLKENYERYLIIVKQK